MNNIIPPLGGNTPLFFYCVKCHKRFTKNSDSGLLSFINPKAKCPKCGSKCAKDIRISY